MIARADGRLALALFLTFAGVYVLLAPGHFYLLDANFKLTWAENAVHYGQLHFERAQVGDPNRIGSYFKYGRDHQLYIHFPLGGLFCFIPAVLFADLLAGLFPALAPYHPSYYVASFTNVPYAAATAVLLFALARELGYSRRRAVAAAVVLGVATPLLPYAKYDFNEPIAGFFALFALYLLITGWGKVGRARAAGAGLALGFAFTVRYELAAAFLAVVVLWLILAWRRRGSFAGFGWFIIAFGAIAAVVPLYNWWARGSAGDFAYNTLPFFMNLIKVRFVPIARGGPHLFLLRFVWIYFLSPNLHNVILYCPLALLGGAGVVVLARTFGARVLLLVVPGLALAVTVIVLTYSTWAWGLRYAYMFWVILAAAGLLVPRRRRWLKALFVVAVVWGVFLSAVAALADFQMTENDLAAEILGDPDEVNYRGWLPEGRLNPRYSQILWQGEYAALAVARTVDYYVHGGVIRWFDLPPTCGHDVERAVVDIWPVAAQVSGGVPARVIWPPYLLILLGTGAAAAWLRRLVRREDFNFYWRRGRKAL
jgi:hypothetical protein